MCPRCPRRGIKNARADTISTVTLTSEDVKRYDDDERVVTDYLILTPELFALGPLSAHDRTIDSNLTPPQVTQIVFP